MSNLQRYEKTLIHSLKRVYLERKLIYGSGTIRKFKILSFYILLNKHDIRNKKMNKGLTDNMMNIGFNMMNLGMINKMLNYP